MRKLFLAGVSLLLSLGAIAQMPQKLPLDPKVRAGKLENGLTYYVMHNSEPKGLAEFYIAQKVGSILEEENQRGLAHFLEHMAFNGTTNFPGNRVISYLETIGVKFGANLNAYTSIDETVYNISAVPLSIEGALDSALLILHDWANEILLKEEEIDNERGVIREELRTRNNAQSRMIEELLPLIIPDNKYAHRLPGGLVEVVNNFTYQELRDYYHKWYRPDLQGIIIVGDFDAEEVENKVIKLFGSIPTPENPAVRTQYEIEDNVEPLIGVVSDKEAQKSDVMVMFKKDPMPMELRPTATSLVFNYMNSLIEQMLDTRLAEIGESSSAPFVGAGSSYSDFVVAKTKKAFSISATAKEGRIEQTLTTLATEIERMRRFGFTHSEFERATANYSSSLEKLYNEREKLSNAFYVKQILNNFLTDEAYPGIEAQYLMMEQIAPMITLEQLNGYAMSLPTEENLVIAVMMPEKEGLKIPTNEELLALYQEAKSSDIERYQEELIDEPLIAELPNAGRVVSEGREPISDAVVWNLSNGATVVIKETDFQADAILFTASSRGGSSLFPEEDFNSYQFANELISLGGLGSFNLTNLRKVLAGKNVSINSTIGTTNEMVAGSSTPKDIETLMQLIYLSFTSIREDEEAFKSYYEKKEAQLKNVESNPMTAFSDTLQKVLYNDNKYAKRITLEDLHAIDYDRTMELIRERFANGADFVFTFVGNVDLEIMRPLVENYIASLPANKSKKENWRDIGLRTVKGRVRNEFEREMQAPKSSVYSIYTGDLPYSVENNLMAEITKQIFDIVFTRTIREEEQGTYGVGVSLNTSYYPEERFTFLFGFDTDVTLKERLLNRAYKEIDNVIENGVEQEDFDKIIQFLNKSYEQSLRENNYWLSVINSRYLMGKDLHSTYKLALDSITPEKIDNFIKELFSTENNVEIIMNGKTIEER